VRCRAFPALSAAIVVLAAAPIGATGTLQKPKPPTALGPDAGFERPSAQELLQEAKALWHVEEDYTAALAKFNAAVEADPNDYDVRLQRAHFLEVLATIVVPDDQDRFKDRARSEYERIADADPDSLAAGMARDGLTRLAGGELLEPKPVLCPTSAIEVHTRADSLYGARRFADAATEYGRATADCPEAAAWWVDFADAHYVLEDYAMAKALFDRALTVDPWNREAHRFLADTELRLGDEDQALHQLVLAVVSDPVYETGWFALRMYSTAMGRTWSRVYGKRNAGPQDADGKAWLAYHAAKARAGAPRDGASALVVERDAVKSALAAARGPDAGAPHELGRFWSMIARAERSGYLDEAIFIHLLDPALAAEYPAFRDKNADRLTAYVETMIMK
jgi:tetratricopeptide (TPR) repeat protein